MPLIRASAFGRGFLDLEICFALFVLAAGVALWVDRPEREQRSVAELLATGGALAAAAAVLLVPGAAGHAAQTAPRGLSLALDWIHLAAGSIWLGGLIGLLVLGLALPAGLRRAGLAVAVPRFSNVALVSVLLLLGSGIWAAFEHLPTLALALGDLVREDRDPARSACVTAAIVLAAVNLLRARPGIGARARRPSSLLRRLVERRGAARRGARSSAARCSRASRRPRRRSRCEGSALARVGPGAVGTHREEGQLRAAAARSRPNLAAAAEPVRARRSSATASRCDGADVKVSFAMLDMEMGEQSYQLTETAPGRLRAEGAGARDGRPLGPRSSTSRRRAASRSARSSSTGWPDDLAPPRRRLVAAAAAGAAALVVAILLVRDALA